jgi:hypothetical protein
MAMRVIHKATRNGTKCTASMNSENAVALVVSRATSYAGSSTDATHIIGLGATWLALHGRVLTADETRAAEIRYSRIIGEI